MLGMLSGGRCSWRWQDLGLHFSVPVKPGVNRRFALQVVACLGGTWKNRAVAQPGLARYLGVVEVGSSNLPGPIAKNPAFPSDLQGFFTSMQLGSPPQEWSEMDSI